MDDEDDNSRSSSGNEGENEHGIQSPFNNDSEENQPNKNGRMTNQQEQTCSSTSTNKRRSDEENNNKKPAAATKRTKKCNDVPIDRNLIGTYMMNTREIQVHDLLNENVEEEMDLDETHLILQLLRIITPQEGKTGNAMTRYQKNYQKKEVYFQRILLCRNNRQLFYIMITNESNKRLFHRDLLLRDNGVITIGSYLQILAPLPVKRTMSGIPLVESYFPAIAMESPIRVSTIIINSYIERNKSGVSVLNNVSIRVKRITPIETTCTGKHCDKQHPMSWIFKTTRGCGCYGTTNIGTSNIAIMLTIVIEYNGVVIRNDEFSSTAFTRFFMKKVIPPNTPVAVLEKTNAFEDMKYCMNECIKLINDNGGFEVVLWYTRGEINDQSLLGMNTPETEKTDAGKLNFHIVSLRPNDKDFFDKESFLGESLDDEKFDISSHL